MDKIRSFYLDILRVIAAFYVFLYHISIDELAGKKFFLSNEIKNALGLNYFAAHYFVIVFFVLSGFLITMSASRKNVTVQSFLIARLGRLYSVLIPSLIFSIFVANFLILGNYYPSEAISNNSNLLIRIFLNVTFLYQSWNIVASPPLNIPFWSVAYEFMYYLIICASLIIKRYRLFWVLFFCLLAGPKIMLLFPAWLIGSLMYYLINKNKLLNGIISTVLFISSLVVFILIINETLVLPLTKDIGDHNFFGTLLFFSWNYKADYLMSIIVAINIYSLFGISKYLVSYTNNPIFDRCHTVLMKISNCSFTLYLFHMPMICLFVSILPFDGANIFHQIGLIILVLVSVFIIATQTEWKVTLWRNIVSNTYNGIINIFSKFKLFF